jgi:hypothetical protein
MPENEVPGGWPDCPVCNKPMIISGDGPPPGGHRAWCGILVNGIVVENHHEELPPLGVCVSDTAGASSKIPR